MDGPTLPIIGSQSYNKCVSVNNLNGKLGKSFFGKVKIEVGGYIVNISRRNFIKAGVAGSATLGLSGSLVSRKWFQTASANNQPQEVEKFTYHTTNCGGRCSFQ